MLKELKPGRQYIIVNLDEPYAEEVYNVLKAGQIAKVALGEDAWPEGDIDFQTWVRRTFPEGPPKKEWVITRRFPRKPYLVRFDTLDAQRGWGPEKLTDADVEEVTP